MLLVIIPQLYVVIRCRRSLISFLTLKEADLKLKGVNTGTIPEGQIFRELIWRLMN